MKKRNQMVSRLLAGMLIGGTAVGTACAAPAVTVAADEAQQVLTPEQQAAAAAAKAKAEAEAKAKAEAAAKAKAEAEAKAKAASQQAAAQQTAAFTTTDASNSGSTGNQNTEAQPDRPDETADESGSTSSGGSETNTSTSGTSESDSSGSTTSSDTPLDGTDSGKTDSGTTDSGSMDSGKTDSGATDSGSTDSGTTDSGKTDSGSMDSGKTDSGAAESGSTDSGSTDSGSTDSGSSTVDPVKPDEEEAKKAEEEAKKKAEEEAKKKAEEEAKKKAEEEAKKKAEEEAAKKAAAQRASSNPRSSGRAYYSGSYLASAVQRQLALNAGFTQIPKKYALAVGKKGTTINIYEGKSTDARVVGTMTPGTLCFIIDDENEDWIFVESGDVRGFVRKGDITSGQSVNRTVKSTGEDRMKLATLTVNALDNAAYRYSLYTTKTVVNLIGGLDTATADRQSIVNYAMQFLGNPYVWGGESLTNGTDCSGFTMQVYRHFGIELPRCSYEQAEVGVKIPVSEAEPGDLVFYARDGAVYHVLLYIGNGLAINASTSTTGIIISQVNMNKACWAVRVLNDSEPETVAVSDGDTTQASSLVSEGRSAYQGDTSARQKIIEAYAEASEKEWNTYGFCRSVLIAQAIQESGWNAFGGSAANIQATDNNVLGMNADLLNSQWISPWTGGSVSRLVPQYTGSGTTYGFETMRTYEDIESCMMDYAAFKIGLHPELRGVTDVNTVIAVGLEGYATDPNYQDEIRAIIDQYDLTKYDKVSGLNEQGEVTTDSEDTTTSAAESVAEDAASDASQTDSSEAAGTVSESQTESADESAPEAESQTESTEADASETESQTESVPEGTSSSETDAQSTSDGTTDVTAIGEGGVSPTAAETESTTTAGETTTAAETEGTTETTTAAGAATTDAAQPGDAAQTADSDQQDASTLQDDTATDAAEEDAVPTEADPDTTDTYTASGETTNSRSDSGVAGYSKEEIEKIYAIVAAEDDTSYDGALAVISTAMNRADSNYGGYGTTALAQLSAPGQYSTDYATRLGGNVPDFVKQAVNDCLAGGVRNTSCTGIASSNETGDATQIGANWYYQK